jgi:DNA-directed RNA polymerase subunit RPC12/RpoP
MAKGINPPKKDKNEEEESVTIHGVKVKKDAEVEEYTDLLGRKMKVEKKAGAGEARHRTSQDIEAAKKSGVEMEKTASGYWRPVRSVRCSSCQERVTVPKGASTFECPWCGMRYRISWPTPDQPRVRGAVWDAMPPAGLTWPKGWPGELDENGNPIMRNAPPPSSKKPGGESKGEGKKKGGKPDMGEFSM